MSGFQGHGRDFSRYNHMSTGELEAILRADFELPEGEGSDMEKILYITEVIAGRRAGQPTGRYAGADEAWESFVDHYLPAEERAVFRREETSAEDSRACVKRAKPRLWKTLLTRAAVIVIAAALVITATTVTASAFGFDFWAWLTTWTQEVFGVQNPNAERGINGTIPEQLSELYALMQECGFPDQLLPTYLPEGYEAVYTEYTVKQSFVTLFCLLEKNDDSILLEYTMYQSDQVTEKTQKNEDNPNAYERGGVIHYIMTNDETCYAIWTVDNVECLIHGVSTYEELTQIINSIYGGNS